MVYTFIPIDTLVLKAQKETNNCIKCSKDRAHWIVNETKGDFLYPIKMNMCSHCVLYQTAWGLKYVNEIKNLVHNVEIERDLEFKKDVLNRLIEISDCDRILSGIALGNIFQKIR